MSVYEEKYVSIKVVDYAMPKFLHALLNNGLTTEDFVVTQEDDYLVVRVRFDALYVIKKYKKWEDLESDCITVTNPHINYCSIDDSVDTVIKTDKDFQSQSSSLNV
jgi:hypothetical protein